VVKGFSRKNKRLARLLDERGKQTETIGLAQVKAQLGL